MFEVCDFSSSCNSHSQVVRYLSQWLHALRVFQAAEVVTGVHHSMHALGVLSLKQRHFVLLHYSVNAGEAPMTRRWVHGKHLGLRGDSGYRGLSTASIDSGYRGSSTAPTDFGYRGSSTASIDFGYRGSSTASTDFGYRGSSTASTDLGYRGLSTAATATHSSSHLVKRYQKVSMPPRAEGKLRYA